MSCNDRDYMLPKYINKKDKELKSDNITIENEGIVEYDDDFLNCKLIPSKQKCIVNFS